MRQFYYLLSAVLFVAFCAYGCGDNEPTGPGNGGKVDTTDTTGCDTCGTGGQDSLPAQPCGVATDTSVGTNGFYLTGSGFPNQKIVLTRGGSDGQRAVDFRYDDASGELIETEYTLLNRVAIAPGDTARFLLTMRVKGIATTTYQWDTGAVGGAGSNNVTLEITRNGVTRVFGSDAGRTIVSATPGGASIRGLFCGILKEGSTGARMALTSGIFNSDQ